MDTVPGSSSSGGALRTVREQLVRASSLAQCRACGCLRQSIDAFEKNAGAAGDLAPVLEDVRRVLLPQKYECLGCDPCHAALAANAFCAAFPAAVDEPGFCPTGIPAERSGWPPLPGRYTVVRYRASVAVCTLNSDRLAVDLAKYAPEGLAIVGTLQTENLGIERLIRNLLANRNIRHLVLCGEDTRRLVGHLPGQSLESLFANGVDQSGRIIGAEGKRPFLKNVLPEHIRRFRENVELASMIGEQEVERIVREIAERHALDLPPRQDLAGDLAVETVQASERPFFRSDPAGFLVIYPDARAKQLVVEHYRNDGVLDGIVAGSTSTAVYAEIVKRGLVSQLDHAAYLGRELAIAERCMLDGQTYTQDRAPGEPVAATIAECGAGPCSCH